MLEKKLQEELNRYKQINRYTQKLIVEQEAPQDELPPLGDDPASQTPPADPAALPADDLGGDIGGGMGGDLPPAEGDVGGDLPPAEGDMGGDLPPDDGGMDTTEEIDITDLVNMTKSIKKDLDDRQDNNSDVISKMDDVFTKLDDLEQKLAQMDNLMSRIEGLDSKIEQMKPKTPVEKLEMRSLDSYPFNQKPQEFFAKKQGEMRTAGKNEYVLTKDEVNQYPNDAIKDSFNPEFEEDEFKF
jgi:hypothetical protein